MTPLLLTLIFTRPFISSLAFPYANFIHSLVLGVSLAAWSILNFKKHNSLGLVRYPLLLLLLSLAISFCFSLDKGSSFNESYRYILPLFILFFGASLPAEEKSKAIKTIIISGLLVSIFALYQFAFGFRHILDYIAKEKISDSFAMDYIRSRRVFLPFITPNTLAGYLIMILPLGCARKNLCWTAIPVSLALILTGSLGALASLSSALCISLLIYRKPGAGMISALAGLIACIAAFFIFRSYQQGEHLRPVFSWAMRMNYWEKAWEVIRTCWLTGIGMGNFNIAYSRYAHNSYLQLWAECGMLGLLSFLWLSWNIIKRAEEGLSCSHDRGMKTALFISALAFLMHNCVDFTLFLPEVSFIWWLIMGLSCPTSGPDLQAPPA